MDELTDKKKVRSRYTSLEARDFRDGKTWDVLVSVSRINFVRKVGGALLHETRLIVPTVLLKPRAIYSDLLWDDDEDKYGDVEGWLCYLGFPEHRYDQHGERIQSGGTPYLVFVNKDRVAYNWRFDHDETLPDSFEHRFRKRLL